ncbi:oligosaccharide flippase family protein [Oscillospiraceae bacterium N12]|jgi:O-antigen/teichoic acid export membrane protein|uniref:Oligosaccharide flippase family protein n=1 Tax=Jilunia laotingensis TaxID=2763675 RepID=A0A926IRC8_9BACT|nr:oligosaccharide flippase family protein [Jilunia laotingensis]MBC8594465.1 oligosaccharide flippase family protein [Jilunia laotingensis]
MIKKKRLINNSISGLFQLIITAILTFLCIPIFIKGLGTDQYGVFALVSVIGNLNLFTNLGLNSSLTKFLAEQGQCADSNKDIITTLLISVLIIIPISFIAYIFRSYLLIRLLHIPILYYQEAERLFFWLLIANSALLIGQTFTAILNALQRIYLTNIIQLIYSVIYWLGIIIVVMLGYHIDVVGEVIFIASFIWIFLSLCFAFHYWGNCSPKGSKQSYLKHAKKQIKYGIKLYSSGIIAFFNEPLFKIIISNFFGMSAVAYYEIALKIRMQLSGLFQKLMLPLFPYISQLTDRQFISTLVADLTKKTFLLVLPICALLSLGCRDIVTLWLQTDINQYTLFIVGIVIPYLIFSPLTLPIYLYLMAKGHPGNTIVIQLSTVIANIISFYLFYNLCDLYTIIISNGIGYFVSFCLGIYYQKKYLNIRYHFNAQILFKYFSLISIYIIISIFQFLISDAICSIIFVAVMITGVTVLGYKHLHIISMDDVLRYFSENKFIVSLYNKL